MAKITRFFNKEEENQQALVKHIEDLLLAAKNGEITNILFSATASDGNILTGYCNCDVGEKQYLLSHVQVDINYQGVQANISDLIEIID